MEDSKNIVPQIKEEIKEELTPVVKEELKVELHEEAKQELKQELQEKIENKEYDPFFLEVKKTWKKSKEIWTDIITFIAGIIPLIFDALMPLSHEIMEYKFEYYIALVVLNVIVKYYFKKDEITLKKDDEIKLKDRDDEAK